MLLHGLLFNQRMHAALAMALAERGHRAVTLDLLGHGASDRPHDMWRYSMTEFGREVVAGELPNARLLEATSIVELRIAPDRLTAEIAAFLDECWAPRPAARRSA